MDDVLYERCNQTKLNKVIFAENIPFDPLKDDVEWYNNVPVMLRKYSAQLVNKDGRRAVSYRRQMHSVGRFNTSIGIQRFPRDIRSYVCGEYYIDIDIDNCHPVILYHLMQQQGRMPGTFFEKYINDRANTILEYGLEDKRDTIKIINTEYINKDKYHKDICDFHDLLYSKILPEYRTEHLEEVKAIEKHIKTKKKKNENLRGCLMAHILQKYENEALTCIVQKLKALGYTIGVYAFDGCMVEKDPTIDSSTLLVLEEHLLTSTGIPYKLSFKSTDTDWVPVVPENVQDDLDTFELTEDILHFSKTQARKLYMNSLVEPEKATEKKEVNPAIFDIFMDYMNKFICVFDNPHVFGFRMHTDENYFMRPSSQIKERVGTEIFTKWNDSDSQKNYTKMDFIVTRNPDTVPSSIYNLYIPAERLPCSEELFETMCPLTNEYLQTVICSSPTEKRILFDWITKMMNEGKTGIAIVLLGGKGCGKSFMVMFLRAIIGNDRYYQKYDDINTIKDQFNAQSESNLLSSIEEVVMNGADFHFTQNVLKSKITEKTQTIRKMHTDGYTGTSNSNYIICTNYNNPVLMTTDNRRYFPIEVTTAKQNNTKFFADLYKEINENIKYIRGFFVDREYNSQMTIPITKLIQRMIDTSISTHDRFVIEELPKLFNGTEQLGQAILYTEYKIFHKNQGDNGKPLPYKYIRDLINLSSDSKYFVHSVPMDDGSKIDLVKLRVV